jgi:serine/threonine-protein kinase
VTPERWQQVKELFRSALEQKTEERAAFLERACDGDDDLRREVDSLLASFEESDHFIETPVAEAAADLFSGDQSESLVGKRLGHYEVVSRLGTGGMGEVYLAQDTRLHRRVALKVLSASISNQEANQRLWREARAAATLEHQHICAIHEIAETDGCSFIVMQYVEGETLASKLKREKLSLSEVLNIAVQVGAALEKAHEAHVIHRDIKPANIIVNDKGQAKVLDFGLAKFASDNLEAITKTATAEVLSKSGAIMGTVPFMSPEQVRGKRLDTRTDIFSFGATLYEMSCGQQPFARETDAETISAILRDEPSWAELPGELQPIVQKSLLKDADERYQTAKELSADLRELQRRLAMETGGSTSTEKFGTTPSGGNSSGARTDTKQARPTSSAEYLVTEIKRHKLAASVVLIALLTATIAIGFLNYLRQPTVEKSRIKSVAVLPLRSLNPEANDQYLGLGIADSIIAKMSQIGELTVRPTSAVRKYANQEVDALQAARELEVDAVLDSTFLHVGDQLRVSVNLLRVEDGASLWSERFDERFTDIFAIQDQVSQQVAQRLRLKLNPVDQARFTKRYTSNPEAYNYYAKAMYHFYNIGPDLNTRPESDLAVDLFKKAVELDPKYALARAQLGYAYVKLAVFQEDNPALIEQAKEELATAERLDPQLAQVHTARYFIEFSQYQGWQVETAIRELRLAQQLDPNVGHPELGDLYFHIGLEKQAAKEYEVALKVDPNNDEIKRAYVTHYFITARPDEALEANKRLFNRGPDLLYYVEKIMVKEAAPLIEHEYQKDPSSPWMFGNQILLLALQGKHREAQAAVPSILKKERRYRGYHHGTYNIARIYALGGNSEEALRWLRVTVKEGFPCYPLFARDSFLDPIRKDPAFLQFMAEMKARWEGYQRELG